MSDITAAVVTPAPVRGQITPPPSKSAAHRLLLAAALSRLGAPGRDSTVRGILPSDDMEATLRLLAGLGIPFSRQGDTVRFSGVPRRPAGPVEADCGESGSTLRFLIPVYAALGVPARFTGRGRLPARPLGLYAELLPAHGVTLESAGGLPLSLSGRLTAGEYSLPGNVSSQFITGLLFALPLCRGDSRIRLTAPLESAGYVDMTLEALRLAGIRVTPEEGGWFVPGGQTYRPFDAAAEADWSQAAFLLAAGALGGEVTLAGLRPDSAQGDRAALSLFRAFGADIEERDGLLTCRKAPLRGIDIDASQIPDLVPVLAAAAALAQGVTRITGAGRLRLKESDRLAAMAAGLRRLGGRVEEGPDSLTVTGGPLRGGEVDGAGDHRIVMAFAVAALGAGGPVTITGASSVAKSWPSFFDDYQAIGGNVHVIHHR